MDTRKKVAVIMGSDSDFPVVKSAVGVLKDFDIPVELHVMSAHRTPEAACGFAASAREKRIWSNHRRSGKSGASGGGSRSPYHPPCHRHPGQVFDPRRPGRSPGHSTDAQRNSSCDGCNRRGGQRRLSRRPGPRCFRCRACRPTQPNEGRDETRSFGKR